MARVKPFMMVVDDAPGYKIWHPSLKSRFVVLKGSEEVIVGSYPTIDLAIESATIKHKNDGRKVSGNL